MGTALSRAHRDLEHQAPAARRDDVLARYRELRQIGKQHHSGMLGYVSRDAPLQHARRLGLVTGRTILIGSEDDLALVFDLAIYTAPAGRSRAVDRYARAASFPKGSDEAVMLEAMRGARFAIMAVEDRHPVAGLLVTDLIRQVDLWLLDEGLGQSLPKDATFATRYFTLADYAMTAGVCVPLDWSLFDAAILTVPQLGPMSLAEALEDRRFAEAIYRAALAEGIMEGVAYQEPGGDLSDPLS
jgi:hypothetical protein